MLHFNYSMSFALENKTLIIFLQMLLCLYRTRQVLHWKVALENKKVALENKTLTILLIILLQMLLCLYRTQSDKLKYENNKKTNNIKTTK